MAQTPKVLDPSLSPAAHFGAELRRYRTERRLSLAGLGRSVHVSGDLLGRIEKAERSASPELVASLDATLSANGALLQLAAAVRAPSPTEVQSAVTGMKWAREQNTSSGEIRIETPAGQYFRGSSRDALLVPGHHNNGVIELDLGDHHRAFATRRRTQSLIVAAVEQTDQMSHYASSTGRVTNTELSRLPTAYELDDLTLGLLWAVTNLDDDLLDDDANLYDFVSSDADSERISEVAVTLSATSMMWLGSAYCARHILDNADVLTTTPQYWTAEHSGEAASGWLLFRHKLDYLRRTANLTTGSSQPGRTFCLPPAAVTGLAQPDRILLFLAVALMESFGIRVALTSSTDYADVPGFVVDQDGTAIIANWIGGEGVWQVDVCRDRPRFSEFSGAVRQSAQANLLTSASPHARLRTLSEYLAIDWLWAVERCAALASTGLAGLIRPRSRLLSLAGIERACAFLAARPLDQVY